MITTPITPDLLRSSVIAVPPLARDAQERIDPRQNQRLIKYLEQGGVTSLLYGGNANLYHVRLSEYAGLLELLAASTAPGTLVIPSLGSSYGLMMDQADILREHAFPTAMVLPQRELADSSGIALSVARVAERLGRPVVLYLKHDRLVEIDDIERLQADGVLSLVKYAVVRDDPAEDDYLQLLLEVVPRERIVSGMGEQPAIVHMRKFQLAGFTSGCVCVAPRLAQAMLRAVQNEDFPRAETIRGQFAELEEIRNDISPIRVLHRAVALAGLADTGPLTPLLTDVDAAVARRIQAACERLLELERAA
jgi:dihydrodipicolinate synthase/N-acetylneuraminate lyase